jgi:hypothetical protein
MDQDVARHQKFCAAYQRLLGKVTATTEEQHSDSTSDVSAATTAPTATTSTTMIKTHAVASSAERQWSEVLMPYKNYHRRGVLGVKPRAGQVAQINYRLSLLTGKQAHTLVASSKGQPIQLEVGIAYFNNSSDHCAYKLCVCRITPRTRWARRVTFFASSTKW